MNNPGQPDAQVLMVRVGARAELLTTPKALLNVAQG